MGKEAAMVVLLLAHLKIYLASLMAQTSSPSIAICGALPSSLSRLPLHSQLKFSLQVCSIHPNLQHQARTYIYGHVQSNITEHLCRSHSVSPATDQLLSHPFSLLVSGQLWIQEPLLPFSSLLVVLVLTSICFFIFFFPLYHTHYLGIGLVLSGV